MRSKVDSGMAGTPTLDHVCSGLARKELFERLPGGRVRCRAGGHPRLILAGQPGSCQVRSNEGGRLSANRT
jgi:hypothetical protein